MVRGQGMVRGVGLKYDVGVGLEVLLLDDGV